VTRSAKKELPIVDGDCFQVQSGRGLEAALRLSELHSELVDERRANIESLKKVIGLQTGECREK
jgi:hypothetical protein